MNRRTKNNRIFLDDINHAYCYLHNCGGMGGNDYNRDLNYRLSKVMDAMNNARRYWIRTGNLPKDFE